MLQLSSSLINRPILSLRTSGVVATTTAPIVNPNNLKIEGLYCQDASTKKTLILLYQDIRDLIPQGFVIDDQEVLAEPGELVRLKDVIALNFNLMNKSVVSDSKAKIGKVTDYATEIETMYIQKIYVSQSLLKSFSGGNLGVDRNQIVEITPTRIVINDPLQGTPARSPATA
jgi:sporulation protein YlmC with PRC-barrel domain